ncbi:MAG: cell wall metabolism sensor histidine kinase WalK [Coprococcus sp.]|nr:cell wall metabolism sensor histidine kinase WalK [Coprococcus sp.]
MSIRSGELVTILGVKWNFVPKFIKSLQVRIVLLLSICTVLSCLFMKGVVLESYTQRTVSVRTAEIQNQCTILSNQLISSNYLEDTDSEIINAELSQLSNTYNGRVVVIDDEFRIVRDTYNLQEGKTIISEDVVKCFRGEQVSRYDEVNRYIEVATPVKSEDGKTVLGMMLVSVSTDSIRDNVQVLESRAEIAAVTISVICVILAVFIGKLLVHPLNRMSRSIQEMEGGYRDNYLHENAYNETKEISDAFNKLWDRYRMLDASREEFVANVSHELKTPLTSMKVLADSLLAQPDAPVELYQEFMGDLSEEIERENKIINDLLELVKLDKKGANLHIGVTNINDLVERILKRLRPLAKRRNIELVFESFRPVMAEVDDVKLTLAVTNLVENAIKYNKDDGSVQVALNADHKYFYLKVADTGIGIPKEDTEHIFERFYRVDKSHSREIGGTGLGLSIARNAVIMHRGAIKVYSEPGEGTTFTVRIPLTYITK